MIELQQLYEKYLDSSGVSTDTRKIASNSLFFALTGENFDGNSFAAEALKAGAKYVVVDNPEVVESDNSIKLIGINSGFGTGCCVGKCHEMAALTFISHFFEGGLHIIK